jgi:hypothetical protein
MDGFLRAGRRAAIACMLLAGLLPAGAQGASLPSFSTNPALTPAFKWSARDYAIRCTQSPVGVQVKTPGNWRAKLGSGEFTADDFSAQRLMAAGGSLTVVFHRPGTSSYHRFYARCLPADFPVYRFGRTGTGGPPFFIVQMTNNYATIFNRDGVPVWWYKASTPPLDAQLLADGTISWVRYFGGGTAGGPFEIHRLNGELVRTIGPARGLANDIHELLLLENGNYMLAGIIRKPHQDASPYGGSADATLNTYEIQELTPEGELVRKWDSLKHIGLHETPQRWWDQITSSGQPSLDNQHFNAIEVDGKFMILSFRHLDAIYKVNRFTGRVIWKLGGIKTSKSLKVLGDPKGSYPLGAQHDPRVLPDGTVSVFDNRTGLNDHPRVVRYRIDEKARTARLVESFEDPTATRSICCGSARSLPSGGWLVSWGGIKFTGGYNAKGRSVFRLQYPGAFSYRAFPVPEGALSARQLRRAMNGMS